MSRKTPPYRSKFESRIALDLENSSTPFSYEADSYAYVRSCKYVTDFRIAGPNGPIYVEAKGRFTSADRSKLLLVRAAHPQIDIRLLFQRSGNTLSKTSRTTYAAWADKHGFIWAEGATIPKDWLGCASSRTQQKSAD